MTDFAVVLAVIKCFTILGKYVSPNTLVYLFTCTSQVNSHNYGDKKLDSCKLVAFSYMASLLQAVLLSIMPEYMS